jgi:polyphosphate kinase
MEHLLRAAQKGKEVTVVVELMARFDEEANLSIAARLEEVGAHVVYGVFGYKTHAKLMLVLRREEQGYRRYVHLGTGNYHPRTTRFYTDFGLLTCNDEVTADVNEVFKQLTGLGKASTLTHLWQAPFTLHSNMLAAIHAETEIARSGGKGHIIAKMNSLLEPDVIEALYAASQAGVRVDLITRGVCCLRPGIPGLSENIRVRSVIGRFLEHHRIFYFHAAGEEKLYLASADWMERNFFRRIEVCFPVLDSRLKRRVIKEGLKSYLADNSQAWDMNSEGEYRIKPSRRARICAQAMLLAELAEG